MAMVKSKAAAVSMIAGFILLVLIILFVILIIYIRSYKNPFDKKLAEAGIVEKTAQVGDIMFNYAEGPDNGPALVLLHAQLLDWYTYSETLPELAKHFHVFAVDYPGHGKTTYPDGYQMTANNIGAGLAAFIEDVIGDKVYITGNSSGGLLTVWLAANRPDLVKAAVLEDPPLFSAEYPGIKNTIAYKSFTTSNKALSEGYNDDFLMYWLSESKEFFKNRYGSLAEPMIEFAVKNYRHANPGEPVEIAFVPSVVKEMIRGLGYYDPRFGNAFYEGTWNTGFDHEQALADIKCPVLLLHANYEIMEDGTLNGALSDEQAQKAMALLPDGEYIQVDSTHVINIEHPDIFAKFIMEFFLDDAS